MKVYMCKTLYQWSWIIFLISTLTYVYGADWERPNIVLVIADDVGYGDLSSYGHPTQEYGSVDQMASEGIRFTQAYSPSVFCSPSRTAILTGRQPIRSGSYGDAPVYLPSHSTGLPHHELTIAEKLRELGYDTGFVGKWHLGINRYNSNDGFYLPHTHGFSYVGYNLPFTLVWECSTAEKDKNRFSRHRCFLYKNTTIVQQPINLDNITETLIMDAKGFILEDRGKPFFLIHSLLQTHTPMMESKQFYQTSKRGEYGDQMNAISWSVKQLMEAIKQLDAKRSTLVVFLSDHGPHKEICLYGGQTAYFKGGKGSHYEGGVRVPMIAWWPGVIRGPRVITSVVNTMDWFSTFVHLASGGFADGQLDDHKVDSKSLHNLLLKDVDYDLHDIQLFFCNDLLMAVRYQRYKVYFYEELLWSSNNPKKVCLDGVPKADYYMDASCARAVLLEQPLIYDVESDPGEHHPLTGKQDVVKEVLPFIEEFYDSLNLTSSSDRLFDFNHLRKGLTPCCNPPYCMCP